MVFCLNWVFLLNCLPFGQARPQKVMQKHNLSFLGGQWTISTPWVGVSSSWSGTFRLATAAFEFVILRLPSSSPPSFFLGEISCFSTSRSTRRWWDCLFVESGGMSHRFNLSLGLGHAPFIVVCAAPSDGFCYPGLNQWWWGSSLSWVSCCCSRWPSARANLKFAFAWRRAPPPVLARGSLKKF